MRLRLPGLLFLSGASSLAYEIVWIRLLGGVFGVALHATTAVLVAYMAGLSLGGFAGGRVARRLRSPLRVYAALEAAIGAAALLVPLGLAALGELHAWLYEPLLARPALGFAVRFLGALAVLIVPTTLMGATLPIAAQGSIGPGERLGAEAGRLYAANTAGAVAGAAATGLWLLPALGVSLTNQASAALSFAVALLAFAVVGGAARDPGVEEPRGPGGTPGRVILIVAGISGFVSLGFEIVWTHVLAAATRDTTFAFTCTLVAFLAGIALGGWLGARVIGRARAALGLGACQVGVALSGLLGFAVMRGLSTTTASAPEGAPLSFDAAMAEQLGSAAALMLLPTTLLGASLPLCLDLAGAGRGASGSGRAVGSVLSANTLGAVLGCVATGLWLVPAFGFGKSAALLSAAALGAALLALGMREGREGREGREDKKSPGPLRLWRSLALGALIVDVAVIVPAASTDWFFPELRVEGRVIFHAEDASGIVEVTEKAGVRTLITDRRHRWGSTHPAVVKSMLRQGALPLLLHPRPARIVEIGLATGIHSLPQIRDERVEKLTVVEISPAVVEAAAAFAGHNGDLLRDGRVEVVLDDGRSFLERTRRRFDVIVLGLFVPYRPGAGALYSQELLAACRDRMEPGGLTIEWLPLDQMSFEAVRSVMATFLRVFPHVEAWEKAHYLALVGRGAPEPLDMGRMRAALQRLGGEEVTGLRDPEDAVASFLLGPDELRAIAAGAPLNTEDRPRVEFMKVGDASGGGMSGRLGYERAAQNLERLLERRAPPASLAALPEAERQPAERRFVARGHSLRGALLQARRQHREAHAAFVEALRADPDDEIARGEVARYDEAMRRMGPGGSPGPAREAP